MQLSFGFMAEAFMTGQSFSYAQPLATDDVVMVSINYRVGLFGLLYGADSSATGNVGIYDQLLVLKWVHNNIEYFTELSNLKYR
jgi:carboxylesterase type B